MKMYIDKVLFENDRKWTKLCIGIVIFCLKSFIVSYMRYEEYVYKD